MDDNEMFYKYVTFCVWTRATRDVVLGSGITQNDSISRCGIKHRNIVVTVFRAYGDQLLAIFNIIVVTVVRAVL